MTRPQTNLLSQVVTMDDLTADDEFIAAAQFEDATRTVVRTLGKDHKLDIIYAGNGAKTDGQVVVLPAQDPTKMMTRKQYAVGQGFANHETLHNLCTDMKNLSSEMQRFKKEGKKLAERCAQAIEDVRIERAGQSLYPGMPSQIAATADYVAKEFIEGPYAEKPECVEDFKRIGPLAITWRGRMRMGYDTPYLKKAWDTLPKDMQEQVDKWCDVIEKLETGAKGPGQFDRAASYKGSHDAVKYAELLAREIEEIEEEEEPEEKEQPANGTKGGKGNKQGGGQAGGGGHGASQDPTIDGEPEPFDPDMHEAVQQLLSEGDGGTGVRPMSTACDLVATRKNPSRSIQARLNGSSGLANYHSLQATINGKTAVMKRKFERALMTAAEAEYVSGQRTGRLDIRKHGANIIKGRENVYKKKRDGANIDTAVTILVDASGSMQGQKMYLASQVCSALAECLEGTPVQLEILAFQTGIVRDAFPAHIVKAHQDIMDEVDNTPSSDMNQKYGRFHRTDPITLFEIKAFPDKLRECRVSLGGMPTLATNANADGDSILMAAKRLKAVKASKHIMIVLSDGSPAYNHVGMDGDKYTKKVCDYVTAKLGINLVGVGIMDSSVSHFYKNHTVIREINDMDKAVMDNIARLILGENFKVDNADVGGIADNFNAMKRRA